MNYYNEHDPFAAAWLRELIREGAIPAGSVDERDIRDILPGDLDGYDQCHFFAGIAGWSEALRLAGWPDDRPVWTGSCPCQPFSAAGRGGGFADERHLWPAFHWLIEQCRPPVVFGEQVSGAAGLRWLDLVCDDLEGCGYAVRAEARPACSVGAPHRRERLWWMAYDTSQGREQRCPSGLLARHARDGSGDYDGALVMADGIGSRLEGRDARSLGHEREAAERGGETGELAHTSIERLQGRRGPGWVVDAQSSRPLLAGSGAHDYWSDLVWLPCRDGKARPIQPGIQPLAHGVPNRVGTLRGAGNAIVPQVGAEFIRSALDDTAEPQ